MENYSEFDYRMVKAILRRLSVVVNTIPDCRLELHSFEDEDNSECVSIDMREGYIYGSIISEETWWEIIELLQVTLFIKDQKIIRFVMNGCDSSILILCSKELIPKLQNYLKSSRNDIELKEINTGLLKENLQEFLTIMSNLPFFKEL